jgi:hypothetical protein
MLTSDDTSATDEELSIMAMGGPTLGLWNGGCKWWSLCECYKKQDIYFLGQ